MAKQKLVLKTSFEGQDVYRLFRDASLSKHRGNKKVVDLLKKKRSQVVTRLEIKNVEGDGDLAVIVELFERVDE